MIGNLHLDNDQVTIRREERRIWERWYLDIEYAITSEDVRKREELIPRVQDILKSMASAVDPEQ